ncbi:MAG TPA: hypothetical protein VGY56_10185 [Verrucomicrobiae bacterium]|nr:hypothetical protein [Verrucomicrobiae bacterium]
MDGHDLNYVADGYMLGLYGYSEGSADFFLNAHWDMPFSGDNGSVPASVDAAFWAGYDHATGTAPGYDPTPYIMDEATSKQWMNCPFPF